MFFAIATIMVWMTQMGEQRARIAISPPDLGRLDLEIVMKNGHLQANLSAESLVVKEIIEANLNHLKQHLSDQGFVVERFDVSLGLDERRFQEGNERRRAKAQRAPSKESAGITASASESRENLGTDLNQIDMHV